MAAVERNPSGESVRPPPLTQTDAITSLLSLSLAAANAAANGGDSSTRENSTLDSRDAPTTNATPGSVNSTTPVMAISVPMTAATTGKHHRRLSSTGKMRRRLSDAREASTRPILAATLTSSAALSLASLSLSTSPPSGQSYSHSLSQTAHSLGAAGHIASRSYSQSYAGGIPVLSPSSVPNGAVPIPISHPGHDDRGSSAMADGSEVGENDSTPITVSTSMNGKMKKRGVDYRCESCSKIYRHPNCLNKHRWEHTSQWREASKFVLSKHQQVQLLEAAAILSFMGTSSNSLPDDRSEWPSFLSGGSLPKVDSVAPNSNSTNPAAASGVGSAPGIGQVQYGLHRTTTYPLQPHLISSSVPNVSSGPRMHDYSLPSAGIPVKVTQVRPGLLGVPTVPSTTETKTTTIGHGNPVGVVGEGGWSLPNSALRSASYTGSALSSRSRSASRSRSRSGSRSDESLDIDVDVEGMDDDIDVRVASDTGPAKTAYAAYSGYPAMSITPGLSHSPGYGYIGYGHAAGYGYSHGYAGRRGMGAKREDDEMSVGFSVREEDEDGEEDGNHAVSMKGVQDRKWDGMEMELDMDMD